MLKSVFKYLFLLLFGGIVYYMIEIASRGFSHFSMVIAGGICFVLIGLINNLFTFKMNFFLQCLIGSSIVTVVEFITGVIVNLVLQLNVWDYSDLPFNLLGQICLKYSIIWFFLSSIAIVVDDYIRYWFFNEQEPKYNFKLKTR